MWLNEVEIFSLFGVPQRQLYSLLLQPRPELQTPYNRTKLSQTFSRFIVPWRHVVCLLVKEYFATEDMSEYVNRRFIILGMLKDLFIIWQKYAPKFGLSQQILKNKTYSGKFRCFIYIF